MLNFLLLDYRATPQKDALSPVGIARPLQRNAIVTLPRGTQRGTQRTTERGEIDFNELVFKEKLGTGG